eukprot:TRINITY_DN1402_c0_g1_i3.p1 TRINITY_DN1402_c0_g1~~TRINITY_DN1402_c0_g1_i3.p1  ORF type:complete len:148 (-),score=53.54 TRINITY_DN1402_c0_g1_i3:59-502(-)
MSTRVSASSVVTLPIDKVWAQLRNFTFPAALLQSVISSAVVEDGKSATDVGAVRVLTWKTGEVRKHRLLELSDYTHRMVIELIESNPPAEVSAYITTISLTRVTDNNSTLIEWISDFSADANPAFVKFEHKAAQENLIELKKSLGGQ